MTPEELRERLVDWVTDYKDIAERHALAETPQESADYLLSLIASSLTPISEEQKEATRLEFIRLQNEWHKNLPYEKGKAPSYPDYGTMIRDAQLAHTLRLLGDSPKEQG